MTSNIPSMGTAREALQDPQARSAMLQLLERASPDMIEPFWPLVLDAILLDDVSAARSTLKRLLDLRPDWLNLKGIPSPPPLMIAVQCNRLEVVRTLLDAGADPHLKDVSGRNVLDHAAMLNLRERGAPVEHHRVHGSSIGELLLKSCSFTQEEKDGSLCFAAQIANIGMVAILLNHGAGFGKTTEQGTALGSACSIYESRHLAVEIVRLMLATDRGLKVLDSCWDHTKEGYGAPVHCAAFRGNTDVLSVLVQAGARLDPTPEQALHGYTTPLMHAALGVKPDAIEFLLKAGANPTQIDHQGQNALHHLAYFDDAFIEDDDPEPVLARALDLLLSAGVDSSLIDKNGDRPQDIARNSERLYMAARLEAITSSSSLETTTDFASPSATRPTSRL